MKWIALQPLTGGIYLGAERVFGKPAECILSYPHLSAAKTLGKVKQANNEYHLFEYLKKHNRMPDLFFFKDKMLGNYEELDYSIPEGANFENIDAVVGLPICSGLSTATNFSAEQRDLRNCNLKFLCKYALSVIKPKIYVFENAPVLTSDKGEFIRKILNNIALEYGYTPIYYRTNTNLHDNVQHRLRTFVFFLRNDLCETGMPTIQWEKIQPSIDEYFSKMPENATQQDRFLDFENMFFDDALKYTIYRYGDDWRNKICSSNVFKDVYLNPDERKKFMEYAEKHLDEKHIEKWKTHFARVDSKLAEGKGWWNITPIYPKEICAVMHKMMASVVHFSKNRRYNARELMHLMGMPSDFEILSEYTNDLKQIGQNVPVRTMQFIAQQVVNILENKNIKIYKEDGKYALFDNTKQKMVWLDL